MSLLWSERFNFTLALCISLGGIGVTLMTTGFLWLGLGMTLIGILLPLPHYWAYLRRVRVVLALEEPQQGEASARLPADLWGYLVVVGIAVLVGGYVFLSELAKSELVTTAAQLTELRKMFAPRSITQERKDLLVQRLKGQDAGYTLTIVTLKDETTETAQYAADFIDVFQRAGWKIQVERHSGIMDANVWILAKADDSVAAFLLRQLRQVDVGIEVLMEPIRYPSWPANTINTIKLGIGPRQIR